MFNLKTKKYMKKTPLLWLWNKLQHSSCCFNHWLEFRKITEFPWKYINVLDYTVLKFYCWSEWLPGLPQERSHISRCVLLGGSLDFSSWAEAGQSSQCYSQSRLFLASSFWEEKNKNNNKNQLVTCQWIISGNHCWRMLCLRFNERKDVKTCLRGK